MMYARTLQEYLEITVLALGRYLVGSTTYISNVWLLSYNAPESDDTCVTRNWHVFRCPLRVSLTCLSDPCVCRLQQV